MANRGGTVECPRCGARANSYPFGEEGFRKAVTRAVQPSEVTRARRERARAITRQNRGVRG